MRHAAALIMLLGCVPAAGAGESAALLTARADRSCAAVQTIGVCRRNTPPYVGIKVRYRQPVLLVETTPRSGESGIMEYAAAVAALSPRDSGRNAAAGSCSRDDTSSLAFSEAHVFAVPWSNALSAIVAAPCEGPPDFTAPFSYASEGDKTEWREARREQQGALARVSLRAAAVCARYAALLPGLCVGTWGQLYPRTGFAVNASAAAASALAAVRAVDIAAFRPLSPHRVTAPLLFWPDLREDRLQMVLPSKGRCIMIGEDPFLWDQGPRPRDGRYVWLYWRKKECCLF
jgi:hypothetical protein